MPCGKPLGAALHFLCLAPNRFPPRRVGGVLFGKELPSRGHRITFLLQSEKPCRKAYQASWHSALVYVGATDLGTGIHNRIIRRVLDLTNNLKVFKLTRQHRYDFVNVKDRFLSGVMALFAVRLAKTRYFYWLSYPFPEANLFGVKEGSARYRLVYFLRGHLYKFLLYKIILPHADHVFVQSEQMKHDLIRGGIPEQKMTSVPMGVSLKSVPYAPCGNVVKMNAHRNRNIVYLGTLSRVRRLDFLIRVFKKVLEKEPDAKLYMIGAGQAPKDVMTLRRLSEDLGIADQVTFTGFLPWHEAGTYVKEAAVCVSPYHPSPILMSTSPTKLVEYMAMGKPVIANDHPEQSRIIRESQAGLCVPYETGAFADAIVEILRDPDRAMMMGRRGRTYVEQHRSYEKIADTVEATFERLCSQPVT
jgi:glycosyltransferase involved in cell wall biosynthesis